jgi:Ca2+-binding EF-hand superfamily protein
LVMLIWESEPESEPDCQNRTSDVESGGETEKTGQDPGKLTNEQVSKYREAFDLFDTDHGGKITVQDLKRVHHSLGKNDSDAELREMIQVANPSGTEAMDFVEFLGLAINDEGGPR